MIWEREYTEGPIDGGDIADSGVNISFIRSRGINVAIQRLHLSHERLQMQWDACMMIRYH